MDFCSECIPDYCSQNGKCQVNTITFQPSCTCSFLYSASSRCTKLSADVIATFTVPICVACAVAIVVFIFKTLRKANLLKDQLSEQEKQFELSWRIEEAEITYKDKIGQGGFGEVWRGLWGDRAVAVKRLLQQSDDVELLDIGQSNTQASSHAVAMKGFDEEIKLIRRIKHINIVLCYGAGISRDGSLFLVLEFCSRGSLNSVIKLHASELQWPRRYEIALHMARGVEYLHNMSPVSIHRDIKSPNVLLSEGWVAKIADFGSAKLIVENAVGKRKHNRKRQSAAADRVETTHGGSLLWSAPEVLQRKQYTTASDVFRYLDLLSFRYYKRI